MLSRTKNPKSMGRPGRHIVIKIPLRNHARNIVDHALVDEADYDLVSGYTWCKGSNGYAQTGGSHSKLQRMHVLIMGRESGKEVDHINRNKLDNRRANLRLVTRSVNNLNRKEGTGVFYLARIKRYWAYITRNGKRTNLGYYKTFKEALNARKAAE